MKMRAIQSNRAGFTLLELLVVVSIMAVIAGALITSYDGLDTQAAHGVSTYNIKGVDQAIRHFAAVNRQQPSQFDSLMFSAAGTGQDGALLNLLNSGLSGALIPYSLTADSANSFINAGIDSLMFVNGDEDYSTLETTLGDTTYTNVAGEAPQPNRVYDVPNFGWGIALAPATGMEVARINSATAGGQAILNNLKMGVDDVVIALGVGNRSTLVKQEGGKAQLSEAPLSGDVRREQYARYIALYHISEDGTEFETAHLVGVIDAAGHYFDESHAAATGQAGDDH
jgi:prepilin-type N-terminal cleavage/methylation domain-containing protein